MAKRTIEIPAKLKCPDCGSNNLTGHGKTWILNPNNENPPKIKVRLYQCQKCGKIFRGNEEIKD